ncbi:MAG: hypothetical protein H6719_28845 [Sandaracinaceae bacterium]|nr:hypothetical protein [Sandaracinaceae bacterium]
MQAKPETPAGDPTVTRGRQQAIAVLVTLGGSIVVVTFLGGSTLAAMLVQLVVLVLLGVQLFRGVGWARWVIAAMTGLGALGNGYVAATSLGADGIGWIVNVALAVIYAWCAFMLAMSSAVVAFMGAQRAAREATPLP